MDKAEARNLDGSSLVMLITILLLFIIEIFTVVSKLGEEQMSPFKAT